MTIPLAEQIAAVKRQVERLEEWIRWDDGMLGAVISTHRARHEADLVAMRAVLETLEAAGALYENRASSDIRWLSDLFHAVAPVPPTVDGSPGTTSNTDESK